MCHDGPVEGFCYQPTDFYVRECLFDMVKIKCLQLRYLEEIIMYLLEINQRPEIVDLNQRNWLSIIHIREKGKEWKLKNDLPN